MQPPYLVAVSSRESGLDRDGYVKCDQPATLPVVVLGPRAGRLSPSAVERLDSSLRFVLGPLTPALARA
jgi:mRNA-degrading endonuclease toxin of MazEF toxin-antitoxin module